RTSTSAHRRENTRAEPVGSSSEKTVEEDDELKERLDKHVQQTLNRINVGPCYTLKLLGYWAPLKDGSGVSGSCEDEHVPWPDIRRAVCAGWQTDDRQQLVTYLHNGHRCGGALGFSACRFRCRVNYGALGNGELTDGEWIWPEGLPHYVQRHAIRLPEEFVV